MQSVDAHCVKCAARRMIKEPQVRKMTNGRYYAQGVCPVCGSKVNKIVPKAFVKAEDVPVEDKAEVQAETSAIEIVEETVPEYTVFCRRCDKTTELIGGQSTGVRMDGYVTILNGKCSQCGIVGHWEKAKPVNVG